MTATNHGLFGAAIAVTLSNDPVAAVIIAPITHFLLDAIPHFGLPDTELRTRKFFRILAADATVAVITTLIVAFSWSQIWWLVIICAFLAASPDLTHIYYEYINKPLKSKHALPRFHSWIQWSASQRRFNIVVELVWFSILFASLVAAGQFK